MNEQSEVVIKVPLDQVRPDPKQPRHWLPRDLAGALAGGTSPLQVLTELRERARRVKWIRERIDELDALADSIASDGLMQPIRVLDCGDGKYVIEEGERRWWAHHILLAQADSQFEKIKAFVVGNEVQVSGLHRRRVAENVLRSGFTVIEMAHALEIRIKEVSAAEPGLSRREVERRVGKENGMSDRRVRQYLALVKLPAQVQEIAQQERITEGVLRRIAAMKNSAHQIAAADALARSTHWTSKRSKRVDSKNRRRSVRAVKGNRLTYRSVFSIDRINQLIRLAARIDARHVRDVSGAIGRKLTENSLERNVISTLNAALTRALRVSARPKSTRFGVRSPQRKRRKRTIQ